MSEAKCSRCGARDYTVLHPYADEFGVGCCHKCGYVFKIKQERDTVDYIVFVFTVALVLAVLKTILFH